MLLVRLFDCIDRRPAIASEELGHDVIYALIVVLAVHGRVDSARVSLVQLVSRAGDIAPFPASGPLVIKIAFLGTDKVQGVDGTAKESA